MRSILVLNSNTSAFMLVAMMTVSCATVLDPVSLEPPRRNDYQVKDYPRVLERWTRDGRVVKELDTWLRVHATLYAPDFATAYLARYGEMFKLSTTKRDELRRELDKSWQESFTFVFAAATHDAKWNDFHRKRTVWRVSLVNDRGEQVDATSIKKERRSPTWATLFPYLQEAFFELYRVQFPKKQADGRPLVNGQTKKLILRFAGAFGFTDLTWALKRKD